jgi:hypothetical protein
MRMHVRSVMPEQMPGLGSKRHEYLLIALLLQAQRYTGLCKETKKHYGHSGLLFWLDLLEGWIGFQQVFHCGGTHRNLLTCLVQ